MLKKIPVAQLKEGMTLGMPVTSPLGEKILESGTEVTHDVMAAIRRSRVHEVTISVSNEDLTQVKSKTKEMVMDGIEKTVNRMVFTMQEDVEQMVNRLIHVVMKSPKRKEYLEMMEEIKEYSEMVFSHSINVALISYMLADWMNFPENEKEEILLAGIVHDIGKIKIPLEILDAKRKLTRGEFEKIKKHSILGSQILKSANFDEEIRLTALNHHERYNGKGYPMGLSGGRITKYGRVIGIADSFEAMTAKRAYREPMSPFQVTEIMMANGGANYDPTYLNTFLYNILNRYVGKEVLLTNGKQAEISSINRTSLSKPTIKLDGRVFDLTMPFLGKGVEVERILI